MATFINRRHKFPSRRATTKMRNEIPADYEAKKEQFILHVAKAIKDHNVPDPLIVNIDETNTQFVPSVKRTRCKKGTRRVRIIGVGHEKPQITVTIGAAANGEVVEPTPLIFGGVTNRCHPNKGKSVPPAGQYYDHSKSHWQTPASFVTYITKTLISYRQRTIAQLGLNPDQKMILILDLHYSHKDAAVLALLKSNNIIPIFIPAGCTDLHQICDVIINKSYKNGVTLGFVDYVSNLFIVWINQANNNPDTIFMLNFAGSVMKPEIPNFVARGINALKTDVMKSAIAKCFREEGLLNIARKEETYQRAVTALARNVDEVVVPDEVEAEEDLGGVEPEEAEEEGNVISPTEDEPIFEIEIFDEDDLSSDVSDDDDEEEGENEQGGEEDKVDEDEEEVPPVPKGRNKMPNTMVGSVKKGKYSR